MHPLEVRVQMHPFETLHLDIPSVVVLVHMLMVIHTTVCMYPYPIPSTPLTQYVHGVCIHSGGTCARGPVSLV